MQPYNRIYYSKIYWRHNMFRVTYLSSAGAPNCICSLWFIYREGKYSLELLMMSGMPLETCWAFNKFWNNKFYYKVTSCWLLLLIHTGMHESMNIIFQTSLCDFKEILIRCFFSSIVSTINYCAFFILCILSQLLHFEPTNARSFKLWWYKNTPATTCFGPRCPIVRE